MFNARSTSERSRMVRLRLEEASPALRGRGLVWNAVTCSAKYWSSRALGVSGWNSFTSDITQITPVPKITSPKSFSDYRPISILPILSEVFEKVIYSRLYSFVTSNCILSPQEYGFRTNHSTELAIATIYDDMICNKDNKNNQYPVSRPKQSLWLRWS